MGFGAGRLALPGGPSPALSLAAVLRDPSVSFHIYLHPIPLPCPAPALMGRATPFALPRPLRFLGLIYSAGTDVKAAVLVSQGQGVAHNSKWRWQ